ncbi:hypothetical protein AAHC03_09261 [Spirometra sp. Aus1]
MSRSGVPKGDFYSTDIPLRPLFGFIDDFGLCEEYSRGRTRDSRQKKKSRSQSSRRSSSGGDWCRGSDSDSDSKYETIGRPKRDKDGGFYEVVRTSTTKYRVYPQSSGESSDDDESDSSTESSKNVVVGRLVNCQCFCKEKGLDGRGKSKRHSRKKRDSSSDSLSSSDSSSEDEKSKKKRKSRRRHVQKIGDKEIKNPSIPRRTKGDCHNILGLRAIDPLNVIRGSWLAELFPDRITAQTDSKTVLNM